MLVICKYCGNSYFNLPKNWAHFPFKVDSVYTILIQVGPDSGSDMAHFCIFVLTPRHFAPRNVFLSADYMQYLAYSNIWTPIDTTYYSTPCLHGFLVKKKKNDKFAIFFLSYSHFHSSPPSRWTTQLRTLHQYGQWHNYKFKQVLRLPLYISCVQRGH